MNMIYKNVSFFVVGMIILPALIFAGDHGENKKIRQVVNKTYKKNCGIPPDAGETMVI